MKPKAKGESEVEWAERSLASTIEHAARYAENHGETSPTWEALVVDKRAIFEALRDGRPAPVLTATKVAEANWTGTHVATADVADPVQVPRGGNGSGNGHTVTHVRPAKPPVETDPNLVPSREQIREMREQLGRKFEASDMTPGLRAAAVAWLFNERRTELPDDSIEGSISAWAHDVAMKVAGSKGRGGITDGQAKGVLNVMTAKRGTSTAPAAAPTNAVVEPGMYATKDGAIYRVKRSRTTGNLYAERALEEGGFEYERGAIYKLTADDKLTLEQAAAFGQATGVCCVCGALLTDPKSIAAGIGPICAGKF